MSVLKLIGARDETEKAKYNRMGRFLDNRMSRYFAVESLYDFLNKRNIPEPHYLDTRPKDGLYGHVHKDNWIDSLGNCGIRKKSKMQYETVVFFYNTETKKIVEKVIDCRSVIFYKNPEYIANLCDSSIGFLEFQESRPKYSFRKLIS